MNVSDSLSKPCFCCCWGPFTGASLDRMEEAYENLGRAADVCRFSIRYLESYENSGSCQKMITCHLKIPSGNLFEYFFIFLRCWIFIKQVLINLKLVHSNKRWCDSDVFPDKEAEVKFIIVIQPFSNLGPVDSMQRIGHVFLLRGLVWAPGMCL